MGIRLTPRTELTEEELRIIEETKQKRTWLDERDEVLRAKEEARLTGQYNLEEKYPHWTEYQRKVAEMGSCVYVKQPVAPQSSTLPKKPDAKENES